MTLRKQAILSIASIACVAAVAWAGAEYEINRYSIDAGGAMFVLGGDFEISGTIGQADAVQLMSGGDYEITGGFWFPVTPGDCDEDSAVGLFDFESFSACSAGPGQPPVGSHCLCFDFDEDVDVDLHDWGILQANFGH